MQANSGKNNEEIAAKKGMYDHIVPIYNNVMMIKQKLQGNSTEVKAKTPVKDKYVNIVPYKTMLKEIQKEFKDVHDGVKYTLKYFNQGKANKEDVKSDLSHLHKFEHKCKSLWSTVNKFPESTERNALISDINKFEKKIKNLRMQLKNL